eukprot:Hpha_TRINITY_DN18789_c0_g1::TRINITY_DN18789_c0_g1_i1::g.47363::m.47363
MVRRLAGFLVVSTVVYGVLLVSTGERARAGRRPPPPPHRRSKHEPARLTLRARFPSRAVAGMGAVPFPCGKSALVVVPNFYGSAAVHRFDPPSDPTEPPADLPTLQELSTRAAHGVGILVDDETLWVAVPHYGGRQSTLFRADWKSKVESDGSCVDTNPSFKKHTSYGSTHAVSALPFRSGPESRLRVAVSNYHNSTLGIFDVETKKTELLSTIRFHAPAPLVSCGKMLCVGGGWGNRTPTTEVRCYQESKDGFVEAAEPRWARAAKGIACSGDGNLMVIANSFPSPARSVTYANGKSFPGPRLVQPFAVTLIDNRDDGGELFAAFAEHGTGKHGTKTRWDCGDGRLSVWRWTKTGWTGPVASAHIPCLSGVSSFRLGSRWFLAV